MVLVLLALVAAAVVVAVLAVATGRWPADPLAEATRSTPDHGLPEDPRAADVDDVRFDTAARGYRMEDVDARLDVLRVALAQREQRLEALHRGAAAEGRHPEEARETADTARDGADDGPSPRTGEG